MSIAGNLRASDPVLETNAESPFDRDTVSFLASLVLHVGLLLTLGFLTYFQEPRTRNVLTIFAPVEETLEEREVLPPKDFFMNDRPMPEVGANSSADAEMALSAAQILSDISDVPSPVELNPVDVAKIEVNNVIELATGLRIDNLPVRGAAGEGTTGAIGAIDRITQDILLSLEERKTLVIWLFDQSGSLTRQRAEINERFDRIYDELGVIEAAGNPAFKRHDEKPLLTSVVAFGEKVNFLIDKPTDNLAEIKEAVAAMKQDDSGTERVFTAIFTAVQKYRPYRVESPVRNVMVVVFTDEVGDDQEGLDTTVNLCRRLEVPV
ncbi:MAG: vWA domain-containing protein, partial [Planctomycetota bacterium]